MRHRIYCASLVLFIVSGTYAQVQLPGNNHGTDGELDPNSNITIDLSLATEGTWDDDPGHNNGIYDPEKWAVVFKYSGINIPSGVTVTFTNHESRAPVVWLVDGDVTISGTVSLNGSGGHSYTSTRTYAEPGPGGFRGGRGSDSASNASGSFGPGGASIGDSHSGGGGGSYGSSGGNGGGSGGLAGPTYGNAGVFPLIGGSGGSGGRLGSYGAGGGAGGGAILIACTGHFQVNGLIRANGGGGGSDQGSYNNHSGGGGGSGGGVRLIANSTSGSGALQALGSGGGDSGGTGGLGRIRVEANTNELTEAGDPPYSFGIPGEIARIWPDATTPYVRSMFLAEHEIPSDPKAKLTYPDADILLQNGEGVTLIIDTENIPPVDGALTIRIVRAVGEPYIVPTENITVEGVVNFATWTASNIDLSNGYSAIQVRAQILEQP